MQKLGVHNTTVIDNFSITVEARRRLEAYRQNLSRELTVPEVMGVILMSFPDLNRSEVLEIGNRITGNINTKEA